MKNPRWFPFCSGRSAALRCLLFTVCFATPPAWAETNACPGPVVDVGSSSISSQLLLVGAKLGVPDPLGLWQSRFNSFSGGPIAGALVEIVIEEGSGFGKSQVDICPNQVYAGMTYSRIGFTHRFSAVTDASGIARMIVCGSSKIGASCADGSLVPNDWRFARLFVCSQEVKFNIGEFGALDVPTVNLDGSNGTSINDLSVWLQDFGCAGPGIYFARSDFDNSHSVGIGDLSIWLSYYGAGGSSVNCP